MKHAVLAKSSGVENLPKGMVDKKAFLRSGVSSPRNDLRNGVSQATGDKALTRMFEGPRSAAKYLTLDSRAAFATPITL